VASCWTVLLGLFGAGVDAARGGDQLGYQWVNVTNSAAYAPRDGAGALVYDDKMWLLGGWNPPDTVNFPRKCNNEVWSSTDGATWTRVKPNTFLDSSFDPESDWEGRHTAGYAVYDNKMWIVGGDPLQGHYQFDVWNSTDGATWTHVNEGNPVPWGPRALQHTTVFDNKIWVMGGQTTPQFAPAPEVFYNDVWNTTDGINWNHVETEGPIWSRRGQIGGNVVFNDRMWILGGGTYDTPTTPTRNYYNDVWSSADGAHWEQLLAAAPWAPREYHEVAVFDNKMWVMEGFNGTLGGNRKDVWYSADGVNWTEVPNTPWAPRHAASVFVYDNALWMVAGNNMQRDVWKLISTTIPEPVPRTGAMVDFESPKYTAGSGILGVDGWMDYLGATTVVTPDIGGTGDTRVLHGGQSARIGGSGRSIPYRRFDPGTTYGDDSTIATRMLVEGPAGSNMEFHFSPSVAGLATPAGIMGFVGGNFHLFGLGGNPMTGIDTGIAFETNVDYLLEIVLNLTDQSFEAFATNVTDGVSRMSLGSADFIQAAGTTVGPEDFADSAFFVITRNGAVAIIDELDVYDPSEPGDANRDGTVDDVDASIVAAHWRMFSGATWRDGDFNGDFSVDDRDAAILAAHWSPAGESAEIPEPSSAVLLVGLLLGMVMVRCVRKNLG
jgi:hypothetical protein